MNFKALAIAGLGAGAALLSQANSADAATFTGSFTGDFSDLTSGEFVDSGTVSYILEASDLNGNGNLDVDSEFDSLLLESSGFSTPEYNFSLFFDLPFDDGDDTGFPNALFFNFESEEMMASAFDVINLDRVLLVDEQGFTIGSQPYYEILVDLNGDGSLSAPGEYIVAVPEPMTLLGTFTALGLGAVAKRKRSAASKNA